MDDLPDSPAVKAGYLRLFKAITSDARRRRVVQQTSSFRDLALVSQPSSIEGSGRRDGDDDDETLADLIPYEYSLEDEVIESIERHDIEVAVGDYRAALPPRARQIVKLIHWDGMTQAEVARHLGITEAAVSKSLKGAYAKGRVQLAQLHAAIYAA